MQQNAQLPQGPASQPFAMEHMRRELENSQRRSVSPNWAQEFDPGSPLQNGLEGGFARPANGAFNSADFAKFQQMQNTTARSPGPMQSQPMMSGYRPQMGSIYGGGFGGFGMGMQNNFSPSFAQQVPQQQAADAKGKGRMVELDDKDWEAQFAALDQVDQDALDREANAAMEAELSEFDRSVDPDYTETDHFGDFESIWKGIQAENESLRKMAEQDPLADGTNMIDDMDQWTNFDSLNTHAQTLDPNLGDYLFENDNFFKSIPNAFEEGMRIMNEGGNLSLAALAFEAAVQADGQHVDAWVALGQAQAQNEKETPAIRALEQAVKIDPSNLPALMSLAVSYTNEGYDSTAYRTLERWVAAKYPSLIDGPLSIDKDDAFGFTDRQALHKKVTDLFIKAAQLSPSGEQMDPDVQVGLGVLFYGAEEFDKAIDCFEAALASTESGITNSRSEVHLLWNRLGATMANSGQSEEAIDAYSHALELRPNFVRARYNLAVSCLNIGCYKEAAGHLLGALDMHRVVAEEGREKAKELLGADANDEESIDRLLLQNQSTNLYDTLRRTFGHMNRRDLMEQVGPDMNLDQFRGQFDF